MLDTSYRIANLACSLARQGQGISTARACGDFEYIHSHMPHVRSLEEELQKVINSASEAEIREASEITNAPIPVRFTQ